MKNNVKRITRYLEHDLDLEKNIAMNGALQSHITEMEKMEPDRGIGYKHSFWQNNFMESNDFSFQYI